MPRNQEWEKKHKHPCLDCGNPCSYFATRCRTCSNKRKAVSLKKQNLCIDCGKPIHRSATRCRPCSSKHIRDTQERKGTRKEAWRKKQIRHGYIYIFKPEHHRARGGYVAEHTLVWEETNGKLLPDGWIIHHLNGIRHDNHPANLIALSTRKHAQVLTAKAKRIQELEALLNGQAQLI